MRSYKCSKCDREVGRENLRVKRVSFREMGEDGKTIRSRVEGWLCVVPQQDGSSSCLELEDAWTAPSHSGGFPDEKPPADEDLAS